jgi:N-acetylneuraminic acid mutarotase
MLHWSKPLLSGDIPSQGLRSHTATLVGSKIFVIGGGDDVFFNQISILDTETMYWYKPSTSGIKPDFFRAHSATLVDNNKIFIFGGGDGSNYFDQLYIFDTTTFHWTKPEVKGISPGQRRAHTTCLIGKKIYLIGGGDGNKALNDTFVLDTEKMQWDILKVSGQLPNPRGYHTACYVNNNVQSNRGKILIFGGSDGKECFNDAYALDLANNNWNKINITNPFECFGHAAATVGSWMYVFGGNNSTSYSNELKIFNLDTRGDKWSWIEKPVSGTLPSPRAYHTLTLYDSRLFMIGG